jgi:two-component system, NarL family, response regulator YdfI
VIRLLIAAPAAVTRAGLEALAASTPGVQLLGAYEDLSAVEALRPDVVLAALPIADLTPPVDGAHPACVLLAAGAEPPWTAEALRLGVRAILSRNASAGEILAAIEAAASGLAVISPQELETLLAAAPAMAAAAPANSPLTARELEVLRMLAEGAANKTIAWKLDISEHTVKFHVASIFGKLGAATRTEAVAIGLRKGLVLL